MLPSSAIGKNGFQATSPQEPVRVSKIPVVPSPEGLPRRFEQLCACGFGLREHGVNLGAGAGVVCESSTPKHFPHARKVT